MKVFYGIFYKSHGKWHGPYGGAMWDTKKDAVEDMKNWKTGNYSGQPQLKNKCEVRKQKWIKA